MEFDDKVTQLENEIKILKNEVQAVLLDLRASYLNLENPFNRVAATMTGQPIIISQQAGPSQQPNMSQQPGISQQPNTNPTPNMSPQPNVPPTASDEDRDEPISEASLKRKPERSHHGKKPAPVGGLLPETELTNEAEPVDEPKPVRQPRTTATDETAHEEVKGAWRLETEPTARFELPKTRNNGANGKIDLATMDGLVQWLAETIKRLGRERTQATLEIAEMMGYVPSDLKSILVRFIAPISGECSGKVTTQDYLASLLEFDKLLGRDNKSDVALLCILCQLNNGQINDG